MNEYKNMPGEYFAEVIKVAAAMRANDFIQDAIIQRYYSLCKKEEWQKVADGWESISNKTGEYLGAEYYEDFYEAISRILDGEVSL